MDNFEEKLVHGSEQDLQELKSWLFKENIRLITASKELETMQTKFLNEKIQFQEEMKMLNHKISSERQRLKQEELFFSKKMEILQNGFKELEEDRKAFRREKETSIYKSNYDSVSIFFRGISNPLALKKRYKELIKMFHPDNMAGDTEIIQSINKEYEELKEEYEKYREA